MENILFKDKQIRILLALRDASQSWYIATLAKASDTTYVHACNLVNACERMGITESEKHGKIKRIRLTEKGAKIAEMVASAYALLNAEPEKKKPPEVKEKEA
ncbi:MAG: MarR family transcriptional regulator [Candidatus Micrarchaeota archaeon]|nr:MarR family transcriptional regulator [Candidatus Micrarchaeota archaeon]